MTDAEYERPVVQSQADWEALVALGSPDDALAMSGQVLLAANLMAQGLRDLPLDAPPWVFAEVTAAAQQAHSRHLAVLKQWLAQRERERCDASM